MRQRQVTNMAGGIRRRDLLIGSAASMAWIAGCSSEGEQPPSDESVGDQQNDADSPDSGGDETEEPPQTTESGAFFTEGNDEKLITVPQEELRLGRTALPGDGWTTVSEDEDSVTYRRKPDPVDTVTIAAMKRDSVEDAKSLYSGLKSEGVNSTADLEVNIAVQSVAGYRDAGDEYRTRAIVPFRDANVVGFVQWGRETGSPNPDAPIETTAELAVEMHQMWRA